MRGIHSQQSKESQQIRSQKDTFLISDLLALLALLALVPWCFAAEPSSEATITSDDLEIQNNGDVTIFTGHVVLTQDPYRITADRMVRTKATGIVDAKGHVVGTWVSPKNEKVRVSGDVARYRPTEQTVDIWGKGRVHVQLDGEKGRSTFHGDRGWVNTQSPGRAKLIGQVTGRVIPAGAP